MNVTLWAVALLFLGGSALIASGHALAMPAVASGIAALGLAAYLLFRRQVRALQADVRLLRLRVEALPPDLAGLERLQPPAALADAWGGYRAGLTPGPAGLVSGPTGLASGPAGPGLRSDVPSAVHFNQQTVVERHVNLALHQALPGMLVGIGICFTFLGLALALHFAGGLGPDAGMTRESLRGLYGAASFKFVTSIVALACSVLYLAAEKRDHHALLAELDQLCLALDRRFPVVALEAALVPAIGALSQAIATSRPAEAGPAPEAVGRHLADALGRQLAEATGQAALQAAQANQAVLGRLFAGQNEALEHAFERQRAGLEAVVGRFEAALRAEAEARRESQAELTRALADTRELAEAVARAARAATLHTTERVDQLHDLAKLTADQVQAVEQGYQGMIGALDAALGRSNEHLARYLEVAESRQSYFFDSYDAAATRLYEKLLQAANILVEADQRRPGGERPA